MLRFINPFTDYGFKKIFGQEVSKDLLIDFLKNLLLGERVIKDLTFLNNEQLPKNENILSAASSPDFSRDERFLAETPKP